MSTAASQSAGASPSAAARTGLLFHGDFLEHRPGDLHPERPARLASIVERLEASGLMQEVAREDPVPATAEALEAVHEADYLARVQAAIESGATSCDSEDTGVSSGSWRAATLAAGAAVLAVDRVMDGVWSNGFVASRPPGHHAERSLAMGFCLINNVAVAAEHLRRNRGLERVAILDWDVHHGNGTQHHFEADPHVFYASLHQYPHYPGTGAARERGQGAGDGATRNCPMAAGSGDAEWNAALEDVVLRDLEAFRPEFVLLSAGFDAHRNDPLSGTRVSEEGFRTMSRSLMDFVRGACSGKLVAVLEGGYDLDALASCVQVHLEVLRE